jgi:hypothetical protein
MVRHQGGCHCGRVRFELTAPAEITALKCDCSICRMQGYLHLIVPRSRFALMQGGDHLTTYTFHTAVARHYFCRVCGVKSFYVPRSHPDDISVNVRCLDPGSATKVTIEPFDDAAREVEPPRTGRPGTR